MLILYCVFGDMIQRITAISFMLLANIVLLAHTVVPHHHHTMQVCLVNAHCQDDDKVHSHQSRPHDHQHDGEDTTKCILKQIVIIPSNGLRKDNLVSDSSDFDLDHKSVQLSLLRFTYAISENICIATLKDPDDTPRLYSVMISHSLGLRAPPTV